MSEWQLAQINVGRLRAPMDDPMIADFAEALDPVNALADDAPGFVWRFQTEAGNATDFHPVADDDLFIINMSVWESIEALGDYVYRSDHTGFLRRRREWFDRFERAYMALWWVPTGHIPSVEEAFERLEVIERDGPTEHAFTFRHPFPAPGSVEPVVADQRDSCPV
jgi:hypothetical protein